MAKKPASEGAPKHHGLNDVIGIVLMGAALLLLVALLSYDPGDISTLQDPPNSPTRNKIGPVGAWVAYGWLLWTGATAYLLPFVLVFIGLGCFFQNLAYLRRRWPWAVVVLFCCMGLLSAYHAHFRSIDKSLHVLPGGLLGNALDQYCFGYFNIAGATIIYLMLYFISFIYLTNFKLGDWVRATWAKRAESVEAGMSAEEKALEKRARELEKQARKLQDQMDKGTATKAPAALKSDRPEKVDKADKTDKTVAPTPGPGLGADGKPLPEPLVRDLSVPQAKPAASGRAKKPTAPEPVQEPQPAEEAVVISAKELAAAATAKDILGEKSQMPVKAAEPKADEAAITDKDEKPSDAPGEPVVAIAPVVAPPAAPPKPKPAPKKKPIAVASTPLIGNYQLPPMDFLQHPDISVKPTESKEELMANARLMQQTLAQFDIDVSLGDITKGPTITRYELHPAPGVKLEKITALSNNIAAALKAERINILAPVPGKSSVGVEVPNLVKTKVIMRDLLESEEWAASKARIPLALGKDVYGHPIIADLAEMPHLLIAGSTGSGKSVCINAIIASLLYKFSPDQLRFVMIDPKVVELQQYNALPHLVVPVVTDPKKVILALRWVVNEMEKRYQIFARVGVRNIKSFNERPKNKPIPQQELELPLMAKKEKVEPGAEGFAVEVDEEIVVPREEDIVIPEKLSYIVVIIDELADLMLVAPADVEMAIARITQMARAAGIHCIVATQRPSVDVITGRHQSQHPGAHRLPGGGQSGLAHDSRCHGR